MGQWQPMILALFFVIASQRLPGNRIESLCLWECSNVTIGTPPYFSSFTPWNGKERMRLAFPTATLK